MSETARKKALEYDPIKDKSYVNPTTILWMYLAGLSNYTTAIRQYVFWQVVHYARIKSSYYESVKSIANSFGITYQTAWCILHKFPLVSREGKTGQCKRKWQINWHPSGPRMRIGWI